MKKLLLLCFLCLATSITFAQEQPPTPQLQVGDTVTVNKDATHYLTGERISKWVYLVKHRIRQIGTKKWADGVLIRGINSWLAPTAVTKVGEQRVAAEPQSAPKAVIVTAEPQEEPKEVIVVTGDSIEEATPQKQAPIVLRGRLVSQNGDFVVAGARVSLANQNISTQTNAAGEFTFYYIEPGDEELLVDAEGFISTVELVQILQDQSTDLGDINLEQDIVKEAQEEILLNLSEEEMNDDEGRSQAQAASSSASTDVFNSTISFAWSTARYRNRGYTAATAENYYIEGLNFNSAERGQFNYSAMGGLNDANRYKEVLNPIEATNFTFGNIGQSTNYLMGASRYAQGWKIGVAGTNRNYKARVSASYASGPAVGLSLHSWLTVSHLPLTTRV